MYPCMFCRVCFHRVLHQIFDLWPLLYYSCLHLSLPLMFYSTSLLPLSYYTMSIPCLISLAIYIFTCSCMLVLTTRYSMYVYDLDLSIHVCLSMHAIWHSHTTRWVVSDNPGFVCPDFDAWSVVKLSEEIRVA